MGYMQTKAMVVKINFPPKKKKVLTKTKIVALSLPPLKTTSISFNTQSFYANGIKTHRPDDKNSLPIPSFKCKTAKPWPHPSIKPTFHFHS